MNPSVSNSLVRAWSPAAALGCALLATAFIAALLAPSAATAQYSTKQIAIDTQFPTAAQNGFRQPIATDGTFVAYSTGNALWSQPALGGPAKRLFAIGQIMPKSDSKASLIYPQIVLTGGTVVFLATDGGGETGLFGLYSIKADGSKLAERVFDSTNTDTLFDWYTMMDLYGYSWIFQAAKDTAVIGISGTFYSASLDGSDWKVLWQVSPPGFAGCPTKGAYSDIFLADQAYMPATNGTAYAFGAGSTLEFEGLYQGPLTANNSCDNLINSGISNDFAPDQAVKILPGQPVKAGPFSFGNTNQSIQIDGEYVYFGASVANGVSSKEDYTGYFKIPLKGGKAEAVVTNLSHVPGITSASGKYDEVNLMGFAVNNGRFVFLAQDAVAESTGGAFYLVDGTNYLPLFTSGSSANNTCVGALDSGYAAPGALNQVSLSPTGMLYFEAEVLPPTVPNALGPCSYAQADYIHDPIGYFALDTTHPLIHTETEISLNHVPPVTYGEKPSLTIKVAPAPGAKNAKDLVPTGTVTVWFTNPEYFGAQQPKSPSAKLNADGEATIPLGPQQIGTYTYTVAYGGDTNFASSGSEGLTFPLHVTAPTFSVKGGTYKKAQTVSILDSTPGATIYYTLNGDTPTKNPKEEFVNPIQVKSKTTIKAIAIAAGDENSTVITATYTIQ